MQELVEKYNKIYDVLRAYKGRIDEIQEEITQIGKRRDDEIPVRIEKLKEQLEKIDDYKLKIEGFKQLAEKHMTSKNILTIEAPPGYRVNLNRLRTWSMMIDPMAEDDPYAQRVYLVSNCDLVFLEKKKTEFESKIRELEKDYEEGAPNEIKDLENEIQGIRNKMNEYIDSEELRSFLSEVCKENDTRIYDESPKTYSPLLDCSLSWSPGAYGVALDAGTDGNNKIKSLAGKYYDERSKKLFLPIERLPVEEEFAMTVTCVPARKRLNEMDSGIRNLIFQMIDRSPAGSRKVYVVDAVRQNSSLIGSLKDLEGTFVLHSTPRNFEQTQTVLEELASSFSDMDDVLGNYDSVSEYNCSVEEAKKLPRILFVIVGMDMLEKDSFEYVKRIITNYERYGISFIAVKITSKHDKEDDFGLSDYVGENLIKVSMTSGSNMITFGQEKSRMFSWYLFRNSLGTEYIDTLREQSEQKQGLGSEYDKRIPMNPLPEYQRGRKTLVLAYGVDGKDQVHSISFENENFAAYLMGASGSGKSTLLHTLITGIIRNYHPDDVELWLADFKMSEFAQYIDPMPPHIKYILLDESQELVCDLIDRLTEKMMERQRFFMKNRELKKVENVPSDIYMPIIFVMLDEFSIMSQSIGELPDYKLKLQNLLAKGRALGIKFLFSSQTFTSGITGLTPTAKAQIQQRIAMKGAPEEITETLELSPTQKTDQVRNWMDALPPHYALIKYREDDQVHVRRAQVMYFKGTAENAYELQNKMIREVNSRLHGEESFANGDNGSYLNKKPVVVDGNSYSAFSGEIIDALFREERDKRGNDYLEDELLISFGRPRLMSEVRFVDITPESRENILFLSHIGEQACMASVLVSLAAETRNQGGSVQVWTYGRNRLYREYEELFSGMGNVSCDLQEVCESIRNLRNKIDSRESGKEVIILLGMERLCGDFGFADGGTGYNSVTKNKTVINIPKNAEVQTEEQEIFRQLAFQWIRRKKEIIAENSGKTEKALNKLLEKEKEKFFGAVETEANEPDMETKLKSAESSNDEPDEYEASYNAMDDFQYIVTHGSRLGYHFVLCLNSFADLKETGCKLDWFRHRLAFQIPADDSRELYRTKVASQLPEHVCQYTDMIDSHSFRPYLHKGIDWDGWGIDDEGNVINPSI